MGEGERSSLKVASFQVVTAVTVFLFTAKFLPLCLSHHAPAEMLHLAFPTYGGEQPELLSGGAAADQFCA